MVSHSLLYEDLSENELDQKFDLDKEFPEFKGWDMIGFHRPVGDEMWQFAVEILSLVLGIFTIGYFTSLLYPYPEITGYYDIAMSVFAIANRVFDIGVGYGISRFIAEYRVKNIERMLMYVRFYIWYQMFTGALQITVVSIIVFRHTIFSEFSYVTWLILFGLQKQWPGMLGIFKTVIGGLQHYDKTNIISLLQGDVFQQISRIVFILIGRWYGATHPEVGLILAMAMGYAIGGYIDDILIIFFAGNILKKIFAPMGLTLKDLFIWKIDKDVIKESLFYGFQASMYPIVDSFTYTLVFYWYFDSIPALATWTALSGIASGLTNAAGTFGSFSLTSSIAESYSNKKFELAEWYVTMNIKWRYFFTILFIFGLIAAYPYIEVFIQSSSGLEFYQGALIFFYPHLVVKALDPLKQLPDYIFNGAKFITAFNILRLFEEAIEVGLVYLWIFVFQIQDMGMFGIIFLVGLKTRPSVLIKTLIAFAYIQKRIMKVKIAWFSSIVIPSLAALPALLVSRFWYRTIFYPLLGMVGLEFALLISLFFIFATYVCLFYFPLTGVFGWWDDYQLYIFKKAVKLSGPSKPIFKLFYKMIEFGVNLGKKIGTHGKFSIPSEIPQRQIRELLIMKREETQKHKKEIKNYQEE